MLGFPVLMPDSANFNDNVSYCVDAEHINQTLTITHTLTGMSFIRQLVLDDKAKFSVSLYYKNSAERRSDTTNGFSEKENTITVVQIIGNEFSYAPEIAASIVFVAGEEISISIDDKSGLSNFWSAEKIIIPLYARIAYHPVLSFNDGNIKNLIYVEMENSYKDGVLKVIVSPTAGEGEKPIKVLCARDVYDELRKIKQAEAKDPQSAMRSAIVTQILCAVYSDRDLAKMKDDETNEMNDGLLQHLQQLKEKTREDWESDDFNPSLAATKMWPYAIGALKNTGAGDD